MIRIVSLCPVPQLEFRRQLSRRTRAISPTPPQARLHLGPRHPGQALHQASPESQAPAGIHTRPSWAATWVTLQASLATSRGARPRLEGFFSLERASFKMFARLCPTKILTTSFLNLCSLLRERCSFGWVLHKVGTPIIQHLLIFGGKVWNKMHRKK